MQKGKYESQRKRKRINWLGVCFWIVLLAVIVVGVIFLTKSCDNAQTAIAPITEVTTEATTEATTEPETEPTTEATTEPETEPTTEATTEPETEPTEEETEPTESTPAVAPEYNSQVGQDILATARSTIGKPETVAGSGPDGFDTTGLIYYCFRQCGIPAPRDIDSQFTYGIDVPEEFLQPGDVVFFYLENPGETEYVGIYTGNGNFIAVSSSKESVVERSMDNEYYTERFIGARRYS